VYGLVSSALWLLMPIAGLTLQAYLQRAATGKGVEERLKVFKVTFLTEFVLSTALTIVLISSGLLRAILTVLNVAQYEFVFVAAGVLLVAQIVNTEVIGYAFTGLRIIEANIIGQAAQSVFVLPLFVIGLLGNRLSLELVIWSMILGSVAASLYGARWIEWRKFFTAPFDGAVLKTAFVFSIALIFPELNYGVLRFFDRFVLSFAGDVATVGIYAFAYTIVNLFYTFAFRILSWTLIPHIMAAHNRNDQRQRDLLLTYLLKISVAIFVALVAGFAIFGERGLALIGRSEYLASAHWVVWITLSHVLIIFSLPGNLLLQLENRTMTIVSIELVGAIVTIGLDLLLIPQYAIGGAIVASCAGWALIAFLKSVAARAWTAIVWEKVWNLENERQWGKLFIDRVKTAIRNR